MPIAQKGVFISHIAEESPVAVVLKKHMLAAFGDDVTIFVSTDKKSIPTGQQWYNSVVQNLKSSQIVVVLISAESERRRWISFEAGVGIGTDALVIPVALNRFTFSQLAYPLAGLQGHTIDEIGVLIDAIANKLGHAAERIDVEAYKTDIAEAEAKLNYKSLQVEPISDANRLFFDIANLGNVDLELLMLEFLVPTAARFQNWVAPAELDVRGVSRDGQPYTWYACYSPRGVLWQLVQCCAR